MEGSALSMSGFIPVVWFTPQPSGTHFRLPHHTWLTYTELVELPKILYPPAIHFPQFHPNIITLFSWMGLPWAWRTLSSSSGSAQNRVLLISVYPITWLIYTELVELPWTLNPPAHHFPQFQQNIHTHSMKESPLSMSDFISVVCFIPQPCFTHFRLPHHLAYIHWTGRAPLNSEPSGNPFPPISP